MECAVTSGIIVCNRCVCCKDHIVFESRWDATITALSVILEIFEDAWYKVPVWNAKL